ncbi:MAG TPA: NAD(P)H-hydrate dehydratase [Candidatus Sulfopaludibacter sp.]|nr:NAD(P)H-hydrate dehydratase [Candidatus Sulfopaludibacter sp.]
MSVPVINTAGMREWEKATWATGQTEAKVIRRVGGKIAELALRLTRPGDAILILAGKGHNGDDARAAREFINNRKIILLEVTNPETALPEFQRRTGILAAPVGLEARPALIIDGLFGIGVNRPLDRSWKEMIAAVTESKIPVLAVDVPSGLNADSGELHGTAIEATVTLTVGAPKIGMLQQNAWPFVGRLEVAEDVGLVPCPLRGELLWTLPGDFSGFPPRRGVAGHKGSYGHLAIIAGSFGFHGAAVLAARGAQRAQPGLITLFTQETIYRPVAEQLQAVMVNIWKPETKLPESSSAVLIGPGLAAPDIAETMKMPTRKFWRDSKLPVIVDASALNWLAPHALPKRRIRVVTPHPGEAARLLGTTSKKVQEDRPNALRKISRRFGNCWVVLKGHQTLIGRSTGEIFVNSSGNPHLAQGGSGDVLAGFIAGLLAQPALQTDVGKTLRYAVWQHGHAADALEATRKNWVVEDLVAELSKAG